MNYEQDKEKPAYVERMVERPEKQLAFDKSEVLAEAEKVFPVIKGEFDIKDLDEVFEMDRQQNGNAESDLEDLVFRLGRTLKNALRLRRKALAGETFEVTDRRTGEKVRAPFRPERFDRRGMEAWKQAQIERNMIERAAATERAEAAGDAFAAMSPEEKQKALEEARRKLEAIGEA